jgi:hypothetical protein
VAVLAAMLAGCGNEGPTAQSVADTQPTTSLLPQPTTASAAPAVVNRSTARSSSLDVRGTWYLNQEGTRTKLILVADELGGPLQGSLSDEATPAPPLSITEGDYDPLASRLTFRVRIGNAWRWYRLRVQDGIATGRFADSAEDTAPVDTTAFATRVTGWHDDTFSKEIVPRVYDVLLDATSRAVLRIDRAAPGSSTFVGRLKIYATADLQYDERPEEDVAITSWDGSNLTFSRMASPEHENFTGVASGRRISGTFLPAGSSGPRAWSGERAEILSHGLTVRSAASTQQWQVRTRARLTFLMMDGGPQPLTTTVTVGAAADAAPQFQAPPMRDDGNGLGPDAPIYHWSQLNFDWTLPNPDGGEALARHAHGMLTIPATPPPAGGYPVVLALNGHSGSAGRLFEPTNALYWYGDSFARHGAVVIAVDMGHRPLEDRAAIYADPANDDPDWGNVSHPAIKAQGMTSDWEEDGERVWDALHGLDYALTRPDVNPAQITVVGLSMGGEVSDLIGALEPRVGTEVAAGSPPDFAVMSVYYNHPCWKWARGNVREYYEPGDLHAMVAGRTLVRETGTADTIFSSLPTPFIGAKQVIRRAQPAFDALGGQLVHYLHGDEHHFHVGGLEPGEAQPLGVSTPMLDGPSENDVWATAWQLDSQTFVADPSVFNLMPR